MRIYIDESGNLGGIGSLISVEDPYFVLVALIARDEKPIRRCIKDVRQTLRKQYRVKSELKFKESDDATKRRILECIAKTNNDIAYVFLRKDQTDLLTPYLNLGPQVLYNDLCKQLLQRVILNYEFEGSIEIVIDKFLYGDARAKFDSYLVNSLVKGISISHWDSKQCPYLQAADFVVGAIARKYRNNNDKFYSKIQHKITTAFEFSGSE